DRPLRGAAPELEDVPPGDVAENLELGLGDLGRPPGETAAHRQLLSVERLVLVAGRVPRGTVVGGVLRQPAEIVGGGHHRTLAAARRSTRTSLTGGRRRPGSASMPCACRPGA